MTILANFGPETDQVIKCEIDTTSTYYLECLKMEWNMMTLNLIVWQ